MSFFAPKDPLSNDKPGKKDRKQITSTRVVLWVLVGGYGVYLVVSGLIAIAR